jgi:hypothetical protein
LKAKVAAGARARAAKVSNYKIDSMRESSGAPAQASPILFAQSPLGRLCRCRLLVAFCVS